MNYGKAGAKKQVKKLSAKSPKVLRKFKVLCYKLLLVAAFALVVGVGFTGFGIYKGIIDSAPTPTKRLSAYFSFILSASETDFFIRLYELSEINVAMLQ